MKKFNQIWQVLYGRKRPLSKAFLMRVTMLGDRQFRSELKRERLSGLAICNDMDGKGYYIGSANDLEKRLHVLRAKVKNYNKEIKALKKVMIYGN